MMPLIADANVSCILILKVIIAQLDHSSYVPTIYIFVNCLHVYMCICSSLNGGSQYMYYIWVKFPNFIFQKKENPVYVLFQLLIVSITLIRWFTSFYLLSSDIVTYVSHTLKYITQN